MYFFVRNLEGKSIGLEAQPSDLIHTIKAQLEYKEGIPCTEQRLIYAGKNLNDSTPLAESGISQDSTVHLTVSLRGGFSGGTALPLLGAVAGTFGGTAGGVVGAGVTAATVGGTTAALGGTTASVALTSLSTAAPGVLSAMGLAGPFGLVIGAGAIASAAVIVGADGDDYTCWKKIFRDGELEADKAEAYSRSGMPLEELAARCELTVRGNGRLVARNGRREEYVLHLAKVTPETTYLHAERLHSVL